MWTDFNKSNQIDERITNTINHLFKYEKITKVQYEVIPRFSKNKDVIVKACTGSGKTMAYMIPVMDRLLKYINSKHEEEKEERSYFKQNQTQKESSIEMSCEVNLIKTENPYGILGVIILPTRELAIQVFDIINKFHETIREIDTILLIGGKKIDADILKITSSTPNLIVATPNRLYDIEGEAKLCFSNLQILVLDEADKMLEMGFSPQLSYLFSKFNKQRRTGLFSATINSQIENIIYTGMRNPIYIDVKINSDRLEDSFMSSLEEKSDFHMRKGMKSSNDQCEITIIDDYFNQLQKIKEISQEIPKQLSNIYVLYDSHTQKLSIILKILNERMTMTSKDNKGNKNNVNKVMIFFATCNSVEYYYQILTHMINHHIGNSLKDDDKTEITYKLHSKINQQKRNKEYSSFINAGKGILLTTDLASRGIDVPNLDLVIQFDPPKNEEVFVHRVGRTARVGKKGESILLISNSEVQFLNYLYNKHIRNMIEMRICTETISNSNQINSQSRKFSQITIKNPLLFSEFTDFVNLVNDSIMKINLSDKWIYDKAVKTFVSYIKFYSEHDLNYIFDINLFDIGDYAKGLNLLRLPRVKEILSKKINFQNSNINPRDLTYKNKNIRLQMEKKKILNEDKVEERRIKKEISIIEREVKKQRTRKEKKHTKKKNSAKEWDDLAKEEKLYKKMRQGKISKKEFDEFLMKGLK